jgi:hypothetical protein
MSDQAARVRRERFRVRLRAGACRSATTLAAIARM